MCTFCSTDTCTMQCIAMYTDLHLVYTQNNLYFFLNDVICLSPFVSRDVIASENKLTTKKGNLTE